MSPVVHALPSSQAFVLLVKTHPVASAHVSVVQGLLSLQTIPTPAQAPPLQTSPDVQALPSSQAFVLLVNTHPVAGLHVSVVHRLLSSQTTAAPGWQAPAPHVSPDVQALPPSQAIVLFVKTQPVAGLQLSVVQGLLSLQTIPTPAQTPPLQASPDVHALPSSHALELLVKTHPVAGLHESVVQRLASLQTTAAPGWQAPAPHMSSDVQALPSSQAIVLLVNTHPVAGLQLSVVQRLASSQARAGPPWQFPPPQVSLVVQAFPSSHESVLFVKTQPAAGVHVSVVHGLLSLQTRPAPGWHVPPPQVSPVVHAFASSQAFVLFVKTHPVAGLQLSVVQTLSSLQTIAEPPQAPAEHASPEVQAFPSSHVDPSGAAGFEQTPDAGSQTPASWHASEATHTTGFAPVHTPPSQVSVCVQALPSVHVEPSAFAGFEQIPELGLHRPASWH